MYPERLPEPLSSDLGGAHRSDNECQRERRLHQESNHRNALGQHRFLSLYHLLKAVCFIPDNSHSIYYINYIFYEIVHQFKNIDSSKCRGLLLPSKCHGLWEGLLSSHKIDLWQLNIGKPDTFGAWAGRTSQAAGTQWPSIDGASDTYPCRRPIVADWLAKTLCIR